MRQHHDRPRDERPHSWVLTGRGEAVTQARDQLRDFLADSDHAVTPAMLRDSLVVVSELVTNAVVHAPGPCVLHIEHHDRVLTIAVRDTSPTLPIPRVPDPAAADGGFGWHLLTRLTSCLEVRPHAEGGKTVTAVLREDLVP